VSHADVSRRGSEDRTESPGEVPSDAGAGAPNHEEETEANSQSGAPENVQQVIQLLLPRLATCDSDD
jgi:hypothetical protein